MGAAAAAYKVRPEWLSRALVSGFVAASVMLFTFIVAYGIALVLAGVELASRRGAATITS